MGIRGPSSSKAVIVPQGSVAAEFGCKVTVKKWFTDVDTVRTMFGTIARSHVVKNEEQILSGSEENYLNYPGIRIGSESVKGKWTALPPDTVMVESNGWKELSNGDVVSQSVIVYDTDESVRFTDGIDFEIDRERGRFLLIQNQSAPGTAQAGEVENGELLCEFYAKAAVSKQYSVHYEYYHPFAAGTDYTLNYEKGRIARLLTGEIETGEKVYIDYETTSNIDDDLIELTIDMAHAYILQSIGSEYEGTQNLNLKYGESYLAMAQAVSMAASIIINRSRSDGNKINQITKNLQTLESSYEHRAETFLGPYFQGSPVSAGITQQNLA